MMVIRDRGQVVQTISCNWESHEDVNELMGVADVLINDYSSTFLEFVLLGKPCVFYANDLADYDSGRGFYYEYSGYVPGPVTQDESQLAAAILSVDDGAKSRDFCARYFGEIPQNNGKRLAAFIAEHC